MTETERKSAEIVQAISAPGYSHAENIFLWLADLEETMTEDEAVAVIHAAVVTPPSVH